MFRIKICGITTPEDAQCAVEAGADALGLNFFPSSKRFVTAEVAKQIVAVVPAEVDRVGVFVNASRETIVDAFNCYSLDWVQLHGDETPEFVAQLPSHLPVIWAFRQDVQGLDGVATDLLRCQELGRVVDAVLIDAQVEGEYGGTGQRADWSRLAGWKEIIDGPQLVLAGGLTPTMVAHGIRQVAPSAVDTASGVEANHVSDEAAGKDSAKMRQFVAVARAAFAAN